MQLVIVFLVTLIGKVYKDCMSIRLVHSKKMRLDVEIEVDIPIDIIEDKNRIKAVEDGLRLTISKGLYEQGVSFKINKINSRVA